MDKIGDRKDENDEDEEVFLDAAAFAKMDPRLRAGLPLLSPIVTKSSLLLETNSKKNIILQLEYFHYFRDIGLSFNS